MENVSASTSPLQVITQSIAGYSGYEQSLQRKDTDVNIRQHLQQRIRALLKILEKAPQALAPEDQEKLTELIKSTRRKLGTIYQSLATPTYLGTGFFSKEQLSPRRLERVYEFERVMLREVENLALELNTLNHHPLHKAMIEDHFLHIQDCIDTFNQSLFEREALLLDEEYMV